MIHNRDKTNVRLQFEFAKYIKENNYVPILINNLQKTREAKQITQKELASCMSKAKKTIHSLNFNAGTETSTESKISYQRIGNVERGETIPTVLTALKFCNTLGSTIDDLYKIVYIHNDDYEMLLDHYYDNEEGIFEKILEIEKIEREIERKKELSLTDKTIEENGVFLKEEEVKEIEKKITKIRNKNAVIRYDNTLCGKLWTLIENKVHYLTFEKFKAMIEG